MKYFKVDKKWESLKINYDYIVFRDGGLWKTYNGRIESCFTLWFPVYNTFDRFNIRKYRGDRIILKAKYTHKNESL